MAITIIVKDSKPKGKTRTTIDRELQDAGWGTTFAREGDADKCEFVERKLKKQLGVDDSIVQGSVINRIGERK